MSSLFVLAACSFPTRVPLASLTSLWGLWYFRACSSALARFLAQTSYDLLVPCVALLRRAPLCVFFCFTFVMLSSLHLSFPCSMFVVVSERCLFDVRDLCLCCFCVASMRNVVICLFVSRSVCRSLGWLCLVLPRCVFRLAASMLAALVVHTVAFLSRLGLVLFCHVCVSHKSFDHLRAMWWPPRTTWGPRDPRLLHDQHILWPPSLLHARCWPKPNESGRCLRRCCHLGFPLLEIKWCSMNLVVACMGLVTSAFPCQMRTDT